MNRVDLLCKLGLTQDQGQVVHDFLALSNSRISVIQEVFRRITKFLGFTEGPFLERTRLIIKGNPTFSVLADPDTLSGEELSKGIESLITMLDWFLAQNGLGQLLIDNPQFTGKTVEQVKTVYTQVAGSIPLFLQDEAVQTDAKKRIQAIVSEVLKDLDIPQSQQVFMDSEYEALFPRVVTPISSCSAEEVLSDQTFGICALGLFRRHLEDRSTIEEDREPVCPDLPKLSSDMIGELFELISEFYPSTYLSPQIPASPEDLEIPMGVLSVK